VPPQPAQEREPSRRRPWHQGPGNADCRWNLFSMYCQPVGQVIFANWLATTSAMSGKSPIHSSRRLVPGSRQGFTNRRQAIWSSLRVYRDLRLVARMWNNEECANPMSSFEPRHQWCGAAIHEQGLVVESQMLSWLRSGESGSWTTRGLKGFLLGLIIFGNHPRTAGIKKAVLLNEVADSKAF
jgi:hypothetical protein